MITGHNSSNNNEYDDDGDYNHCDDDVDDDADVDDTKDDHVSCYLGADHAPQKPNTSIQR